MSGPLRIPQAALFVAVLACVAFINSFGGKFVFDDIHEIVRNPHLTPLVPPWQAMFVGNELPARPLPYLSFAIDHAIWGDQPFGYHLTNLAIHVIAALALFDLTRCALSSPRLRGRWEQRALPMATVIATLWAIHPLQTQAVTYIYQRIESMTGMFCLVSLAAFAEASARRWSRRWLATSIVAAAAAMASKENAVVLPLLILAYDWLFVPAEPGPDTARNWARGLRHRGWYYLLLAATWAILAGVLLSQRARYQELNELPHRPWDYLLTQSGVILHYLRLAVLPIGQQFDYGGWPVAQSLVDVWPAFLAVAALVAVTAAAVMLRRPAAWIGVLFFLALAPTSSVMPVEAVANEHRMYVALAAAVAGLVLAVMAAFDRFGTRPAADSAGASTLPPRRAATIAAGFVILLLVVTTQVRNQLYATPTGVWLDVLRRDRESPRAYWMMAAALDTEGDPEFATAMAEEAIRRDPNCVVLSQLAKARARGNDNAMAEYYLRFGYKLIRDLQPAHAKSVQIVTSDLATVLRRLEKFPEVRELCESILVLEKEGHELHPPVKIAVSLLLAECVKNEGDLARADSLTEQALAVAKSTVPLTNANALNASCLRADVLLAEGQRSAARDVLEESVRALRAQSRLTKEQQHFLDLFLRMLRESAGQGGPRSDEMQLQLGPAGG